MFFARSEEPVPVRVRLTFGFVLAFGALLVCLEFLDERALKLLQERAVQEDLAEKVEEVKDSIQSVSEAQSVPAELSEDGSFVEVVGPDGHIVSRSDTLGDAYIPGTRTQRIVPPRGAERLADPVATADAQLSVPGGKKYRAVVGVPVEAIEEARAQKRVSGIVAVGLGLLLTGLIGYAFSGIALRPVERLRRQVEAIEAEDVRRRIDLGRLPPDEIGRLARTFNELLDRVAVSREKQQRFIEDASHDLRSPITVIAGQSQLLLKRHRQDPALLEPGLRGILREAERLRRLVDDLLAIAQTAPLDSPGEEADVAAIAAEMVASRRHVHPQVRLGALEPGPVKADPDHIRRILANLLDNATRAVAADGTVEVAVGRHDGIVRLTVRDDGVGIPAEDVPRVFDRFYRVATVRDREGSGLGLSVVQSLASLHGGSVSLTSVQGAGTEVRVDLPVAGETWRGDA
ncbi:MAG: HAMP domain-containing protein [Candidatus Sericytochromatia bacterium]|nr:HAMP domain-containing protein [Candidatus Tanganyikabacteria bacterium]